MCSIAKYKVKKAEKLSGRKDNSSARDLFIWLFSSVANYVKIWRKNCPDEKMIAVLVSVGVGVKSDVAIKWGTPGGPRINTLNLHIWSTPSWNTFNFERDEKSIFFRSYFENWILELCLPPINEETSSRALVMHQLKCMNYWISTSAGQIPVY